MTDEELALLSPRGEKTAWEELYKRYKPGVLKIARRFFLSGGETEDLVQEGMCGLYSAVNGFNRDKEGASFSAYAYSCVRNRIVDAVKLSTGAKHSALNNFLPIVEVGGISEISPEDELIRREDKRELLSKMSKILSSLEFKAVVMYTDGMTMAEISSALDKSPKSVDNAINRAKNKLQKLISAED